MQGVFGELSLSVRHLAWLHAVPKAPDKFKPKEGSRLWQLKEKGREPKLPSVSCSYLQDLLFEVGPASSTGLGPAPLSWQEIESWARAMPRGVQPWEKLFIRQLSMEWVAELARAEDPSRPAPWDGDTASPVELARVADRLEAALDGRVKRRR